MPPYTVYRVLAPDEPRPTHVIRVRVPIAKWADAAHPKAGYRCRKAVMGGGHEAAAPAEAATPGAL